VPGAASTLIAPGPQGPDMLRAFGVIRRDPLRFLDLCRRRFGPVVAFPLPGAPVLYVSDPDLVRHLLVTNHRAYSKRTVQYDALALVTGEGLLTSDGEAWRAMRRLVQPAFHHATLSDSVSGVAAAADALSLEWSELAPGGTVDLDEAMMRTTLRVVGASLFGADLGDQVTPLVAAVAAALEVVVRRAQLPVSPPSWLPTPGNRALGSAMHSLDDSVERLVQSRRSAGITPADHDVLALLLRAQDQGLVSPAQVRNEVVTLIVAGHETVAATMTWTWLLLGGAPDATAHLRDEADAVLGAGPPSLSTVGRLTFARAVVDESLRMFPPAWVISRRCIVDDLLGEIEVPAGSTVFCSPSALHRDPSVWERPERFEPQRFLAPRSADLPRESYLPFGAGPRLCIGRDLALLEATLLLAVLVRRHDVVTPDLDTVRAHAGVTQRPAGGLPGRVAARDSATG
jgi:cytochrome P450